jgi:hypothetical protein
LLILRGRVRSRRLRLRTDGVKIAGNKATRNYIRRKTCSGSQICLRMNIKFVKIDI